MCTIAYTGPMQTKLEMNTCPLMTCDDRKVSLSANTLSPSSRPCGMGRTSISLCSLSGWPSPCERCDGDMEANIGKDVETHLCEDDRPSTNKERQVVRVDCVHLVLLSHRQPEDRPDRAVDPHVDHEAGVGGSRQGGFGVVGGGGLGVHLLLGAAAVCGRSGFLELVAERAEHLVERGSACPVVALKEPGQHSQFLKSWCVALKFES